MGLLLLYLFIALGFSFLCSMLEAVLLSVPRSHVTVLVEQNTRTGRRLERMKEDVDRPLAAILTLNTFAHTLGAAGVGAQAGKIWGEAWVGVVGFILTLLILVISEIIPKTLGAVHAKGLAPFAAWVINFMIYLLWPLVIACNWISKRLSPNQREAQISRDEVASVASLALDEGSINRNESQVIRNLIALRETTVERVMTPRTVAFTLSCDQTVEQVIGDPPQFARIPVIGSSLDDVRGLVHRHDLFAAMSDGRGQTTLDRMVRPMHPVPEQARLTEVLEQFIRRREHLFLVVDEYGGTAGILALEDVLETLLGVEIVDETDSVEDMQKLAMQMPSGKPESEVPSPKDPN